MYGVFLGAISVYLSAAVSGGILAAAQGPAQRGIGGVQPAVQMCIRDRRYTAQDRHHKVETIAGIAGEPVGKHDERRDEQQQVEHQPGTVVAAAQKHP